MRPGHPHPTLRAYRPDDMGACLRLYTHGLLGGAVAEDDTAVDVEDITRAYLSRPGGGFWVAEEPSVGVVGMVGVQHHETDAAEVRRLRVLASHQSTTLPRDLLRAAVAFCRDRLYLKVTLDTYFDTEQGDKILDSFHYRLARRKQRLGKLVSTFYLDMYAIPTARRTRVD